MLISGNYSTWHRTDSFKKKCKKDMAVRASNSNSGEDQTVGPFEASQRSISKTPHQLKKK